MNSMKCFQCVLKHISGALSYGKEVMSGHGQGSDLDHRIDYLGEIKNLEDHLQLIDSNIFMEVKNYREQLQNKHVAVDDSDLQYLRELYLRIENMDNQNKSKKHVQTKINSIPDVVFLHLKDKNYFDLTYKKMMQNLTDYGKVCYLESDFDMTEYDMQKIDYKDIDSQYILIMNEKTVLLKQFSAQSIMRIQDFKANFNFGQIITKIRKNQPYFYYDDYPCLVKKKQFEQYLKKEYPLTYYCNQYKVEYEYKSFQVSFKLNKVLCCSNKQKIKTALFCYVENQIALDSIKQFFKIDQTSQNK